MRADTRNETILIRPVTTPLRARGMLTFHSGLTIQLDIEARDKPGMLSVAWDLPPPVEAPPPPPNEIRPSFDKDRAYANYALKLEEGQKPPWYPVGAVDD